MSRRWARLIWVVLVIAACDPSGAVDSVVQSTGSPATVTTSAGPSSTTITTMAGLGPEFLFWVAPVDFEESRVGWEAFGLPDQEPKFLAMANCWEENGYGEFAGHLKEEATPAPGGAGVVLLTPMRRLREVGFTDERDSGVRFIPESAGPRGIPGDLESVLKYGPDVGLRMDDAAGIRNVGEMCWPDGWITTPWMGIPEDVELQWITRIAELDQEPELAAVIGDTVTPCLRAIDPFFEDALDPDDWLSRAQYAPKDLQDVEGYASEMWAMPEETLLAWGRAFAECMAPLEEARRPLRLAAREAWVEEYHSVLIDFQAQDGLQTGGP